MRYFVPILLVTHLVCSSSCASNATQAISPPRITGVYTPAEMAELIRQWNTADGESIFVVSDRFAFFLTGNPVVFYVEMASHPEQFDAWMSQLGGTTLTDFGRGCIDRRCLREQMIHATESSRGPTKEAESVRLKILTLLRKTEVRSIE